MQKCTDSLDHFDYVTGTELIKIISGKNKTIFSSDPVPTRCIIYMLLCIYLFYNTCEYMLDHKGFAKFMSIFHCDTF